MKKIINLLAQYQWYRNNTKNKIFAYIWNKCALHENYWVYLGYKKSSHSEFHSKYKHNKFCEKILIIEGDNWNSQYFCGECKNELVYSDSIVEEKNTPNGTVVKYICSFCSNTQYGNLDITPGILSCDKNGIPNI